MGLEQIAKLASPIGVGVGILGSIGKMFSRAKANKDMRNLIGKDPTYNINPIAQQRLALAQTMLNARMPGAVQVERNINSNQANQLSNIGRNASDASQLLSLGAQTQGQTNDAYANLGINEAQDYQRRYGNLLGAQEGMINEGDKVFNDQVRRFGDETQLRGSIAANRGNTWGDISNMGFGIADFAANGGFGGNRGVAKTQMPQRRNVFSGDSSTTPTGEASGDVGGVYNYNQNRMYNWYNRPI